MLSDIRLAIRSLRRQPAFAITALLTLALGIGANTAIFSVVYGVLLRPLDYPDPDRLVRVYEEHPGGRSVLGMNWSSDTTLNAWMPNAKALSQIGSFSTAMETVGQTSPERWRSGVVSPSIFPMMRVGPVLGRLLESGDEKPGAAPVAVLTYQTWRDRFGAKAAAIGQALWLDGKPFQIVGVVQDGFVFPSNDVMFYRPYVFPGPGANGQARMTVLQALGRLADGATLEQAEAEGTRYARSVPRPLQAKMFFGDGGEVVVHVRRWSEFMTSSIRPALLVLSVGVGFVLLIACANVANLFLSRGVARQRELAVRSALGASRSQLIRQLLTESLVLSTAGGALGVALAWALIRILPAAAPDRFPRLVDIHLDATALWFAVAVSLVTGVLSGILPAMRGAAAGISSAMIDGDLRTTGSAGKRLRRGLLVAEAALAVILLVGAGLLGRSFVRLANVDPGYDATNVLAAEIMLPPGPTPETTTAAKAYTILDRLHTLPGIKAIGAGNMGVLTMSSAIRTMTLQERDASGQPILARAIAWVVSPGYAEALGLRVKSGRMITDADIDTTAQVVVVNESFARTYWNDGTPIVGRRYDGVFGEKGTICEVIGVVGDMLKDGNDTKPEPAVFSPAKRNGRALGRSMSVAIRTDRDPIALAPDLRRLVLDVEPQAAFDSVGLLTSRVSASVAQPRFSASVLGGFAALALLLAAIGLYGVLSYGVSQRRREMGIRAAMGASRAQLVRLVVGEGMVVVVIGLVVGLGAAAGLARFIQTLLFGITPLDRWAYAVAPAVLLLVAAIA